MLPFLASRIPNLKETTIKNDTSKSWVEIIDIYIENYDNLLCNFIDVLLPTRMIFVRIPSSTVLVEDSLKLPSINWWIKLVFPTPLVPRKTNLNSLNFTIFNYITSLSSEFDQFLMGYADMLFRLICNFENRYPTTGGDRESIILWFIGYQKLYLFVHDKLSWIHKLMHLLEKRVFNCLIDRNWWIPTHFPWNQFQLMRFFMFNMSSPL